MTPIRLRRLDVLMKRTIKVYRLQERAISDRNLEKCKQAEYLLDRLWIEVNKFNINQQ
jgi:hypothetical protein